MKEYFVTRDGERDIIFTGEVIATAKSSPNTAAGNYSRSTGRWSELTLYRTQGGKYVCQEIGRTQWQGEHDRYRGAVCEDADCVCEFFGQGWLAKELYADTAEIDCSISVD
jgi:hypothetical protein